MYLFTKINYVGLDCNWNNCINFFRINNKICEECTYLPKLTMRGWIVIGIIVLISFVLITKYVGEKYSF